MKQLQRIEHNHNSSDGNGSNSNATSGGNSGDDDGTSDNGAWQVTLDSGECIEGHRLVLASGGLSFPKVGTDGTGHKIAKQVWPHLFIAEYCTVPGVQHKSVLWL